MDNIKNTRMLVKHILEEKPICRNSDSLLELEVLRVCAERRGIDIAYLPVTTLFRCRNSWNFPKSETIRRNRQIIQSKYPELAADETTDARRTVNEERMREYVREAKYDA